MASLCHAPTGLQGLKAVHGSRHGLSFDSSEVVALSSLDLMGSCPNAMSSRGLISCVNALAK